MPGRPTPGRMAIPAQLDAMQRQLAAMARQQTQIITDPTEATGDPDHGHAVAVIGELATITGLAGFGVAIYANGEWARVAGLAGNALELAPPGTSRHLAMGTAAVTILAGANNATLAVNHGLGTTPTNVWANGRNNPSLLISDAKILAVSPTQVTVQAYTANLATVAADTTITCDWFAVA